MIIREIRTTVNLIFICDINMPLIFYTLRPMASNILKFDRNQTENIKIRSPNRLPFCAKTISIVFSILELLVFSQFLLILIKDANGRNNIIRLKSEVYYTRNRHLQPQSLLSNKKTQMDATILYDWTLNYIHSKTAKWIYIYEYYKYECDVAKFNDAAMYLLWYLNIQKYTALAAIPRTKYTQTFQ